MRSACRHIRTRAVHSALLRSQTDQFPRFCSGYYGQDVCCRAFAARSQSDHPAPGHPGDTPDRYPMPSVSCDVNAHVGKDRKVEHGLSLIARGIVHDVHTSVRPTPCRADQYLEGSVILLKQVFIDLKTAAHTTH